MNPVALLYRTLHPFARIWWMIRRPKVEASVAVVERGGDVLLVRSTYGNREEWRLPGGYRKASEDAGAAAVREVLEETGLVLHGTRHLTTDRFTEYGRNITLEVYRGNGFGKVKIDPHEVAEAAWFNHDHLPANLGGPTRRAIALMRRK